MIIDIKYHIASLTAVFLALGIGILIGTSMIGSDTITKQQKNMIDGIEKEFTILREENKQNTDALLQAQDVMLNQQQFNQAVMPLLVRNKLQGRKIALVDVNYNRDHDGLANVLRSSGADVQSITAVNLAVLKDQNISKQTAGMLGKSKDADPEKYLSDLARLTAEAIASGRTMIWSDFWMTIMLSRYRGLWSSLQDVI